MRSNFTLSETCRNPYLIATNWTISEFTLQTKRITNHTLHIHIQEELEMIRKQKNLMGKLTTSVSAGSRLHKGTSWLHCRYQIHILWPKPELPPVPCNRAWTECNHGRNRSSGFPSTYQPAPLVLLATLEKCVWCDYDKIWMQNSI